MEQAGQRRIFMTALAMPLPCAILPFTLMATGSRAYANAGAWCFISTENKELGTMWRFGLYYCPLWLCIIYSPSYKY